MALGYGDVKGTAPRWLDWDKKFNQEIISRIVQLDAFDDPIEEGASAPSRDTFCRYTPGGNFDREEI